MAEKSFCAQISAERQEPYIGLAANVELTIMVEYTGPWEYIAVYYNRLPERAKAWVKEMANSYYTLRCMVIFIRKDRRDAQEPLRCFVAVTREERKALYALQLNSYDDLLELDLEAFRGGDPLYDRYLVEGPLYLICTNGKHDRCCARFGMPIYREFARQAPAETWHCSHIGGDQYAANVLCLPRGAYYSRVTIPEVQKIIEADRRQQLYLEKCRGQTCYAPHVQVAELAVRARTENRDLSALRLLDISEMGEESQTIRFHFLPDDTIHQMTVHYKMSEVDAPPCSVDSPGKNARHDFQVTAYECGPAGARVKVCQPGP